MRDLSKLIENTDIRITDLSKASNVSRQTIYSIIKKDVTPTIGTIKRLCNVLGVNYIDYLPIKYSCLQEK